MSKYVEDDVKQFTVNLISDKLLSISDVIYNEDVGIDEQFTISYVVNNLTNGLVEAYGVIIDKDTGKPLKDSYWQYGLGDGGLDYTYTHTGTQRKLNLQIRVGLA